MSVSAGKPLPPTTGLKRLLSAALFLVLAFLPAAPQRLAAQTENDGQSVSQSGGGPASSRILFTVPLSGPLAGFGQNALQGAELALKTWGGGYTLEAADEMLPYRDDLPWHEIAVIVGYFTETRFVVDAPRNIYLRKPVLLPYLTTQEPASRGPATFFRLMPTYAEQGRFMALEILKMKKRPQRILIITGSSAHQAALEAVLEDTLRNPPQPPPPPPPAKGQRAPKPPAKIRPLEAKAQVVIVDMEQAKDPESIPEFSKARPELIIMAVDLEEALTLAPILASSKFHKVPIWGGAYLGFRELGAAYVSLELNLILCLPVTNLANDEKRDIKNFKNKYSNVYHSNPTWIAALAYDSMTLAIKAASNSRTIDERLKFLSEQSHHGLGVYKLTPGAGDNPPPMAFTPIRQETLGFLP